MADILLSPFDNFFLFTIESELNGLRVATDLSVYREAYLTFKDNESYAVRVKSSSLFETEEAKRGEVNFVVLSYDALQIRKIKSKNFLISVIRDYPNDNSDETVIFSGTWDLFEKSAENNYNRVASSQNVLIQENNIKIASLEAEKSSLLSDIESLNDITNSKEAEKTSLENILNSNLSKLSSLKTSGLTKEGLISNIQSLPNDVIEKEKKSNIIVPSPIEGLAPAETVARRRRGLFRRIINA